MAIREALDVNDKDSSSVSGSCMQKPTHLLHGYLILSVMTRIRVEFLSKRGGIIRIHEVGGVVALHVDTRRLPKHASIAERRAINPFSPSKQFWFVRLSIYTGRLLGEGSRFNRLQSP
jgi:hypothetical protein